MQKVLNFLLMTALAVFCFLPVRVSEAASVALLPLVNNVADYPDLNTTYFAKALEAVKSQSQWEVLDGEELDNAVKANVAEGQLPTAEAMRIIAQETGADVVLAMQIDVLDETYVHSREDFLVLNMQGKCLSYNSNTDKFSKRKIYEDGRFEVTEGNRWDWKREQFALTVKREVNKALGKTKISVDRPRISKL